MTSRHDYWCLSFWWVTSSWLPQLQHFEFTVWFPHKQYMHSALFHHLHPWSQVCSRGAKRRSSRWRSQQEICPSCRCMSCSHLSVRLRPRNSNRWDLCKYMTCPIVTCIFFRFVYIFIYIIINNPLVLVTCILIVPFKATIHHNDFYFSYCMFKMLFSETTNQNPSWF